MSDVARLAAGVSRDGAPTTGGDIPTRRRAWSWRRCVPVLLVANLVVALTMAIAAPAPAASGAVHFPGELSGPGGGPLTAQLAPELAGNMLASGRKARGRRVRKLARQGGVSLTPSPTRPYWACPEGPCEAIIDPVAARASGRWALAARGRPLLEGHGEKGGLDPQDLQSAYNIPTSGGSTQTIAVVNGDGDPKAESDLAKYRKRYDLGPCTKADGCFREVNERGEEYNERNFGKEWELEASIDLDMASAACPHCHILLVEATFENVEELVASVNTAARLGATEISNSYGIPEENCEKDDCEEYSADYDHPGVMVTASAGDQGYDNYQAGYAAGTYLPSFPAASPYVVAVGGTSLRKAANSRGWSEAVWSEPELGVGSGGGCSRSEPKPVWQTDTGCANRTDNDAAAVAACETPVSVYTAAYKGWIDVCGTSVSSPLLAGIEAHASEYARSLPGADAFYADPGALFDVTTGGNEVTSAGCAPPTEDEYLSCAEVGYDGPTGNGAPDGPLELAGGLPFLATNPAGAVTSTAATLNGTVDALGTETTYRFEYGTTTSYGTSVPVPDASAGSSTSEREVSQTITGLESETTYHYRLVASDGAGAAYGEDRSFTTAPASVTGVAPDSGPAAGGGAVTITGTDFAGVTAVKFGSVDAKSFKVESETSISAYVPAGSGTVNVTVTTPAGTSSASSVARFTYRLGSAVAWGEKFRRAGRRQERRQRRAR